MENMHTLNANVLMSLKYSLNREERLKDDIEGILQGQRFRRI